MSASHCQEVQKKNIHALVAVEREGAHKYGTELLINVVDGGIVFHYIILETFL